MTLPERVVAGATLFNEGRFFEAHEAWEDHWGGGSAEERRATLGLIKAAVALHHLASGNVAGFAWQAERAVAALRDGAVVWPELRLAQLADALDGLAAEVRFHGRLREPVTLPNLPL